MEIPREPKGLRRDYTRAPTISKAYLLGIIHDATRRKLTYRLAQKNRLFLVWLKAGMFKLGIKSWIYKEGKSGNVWILEFSNKHLIDAHVYTIQDKADYLKGYFDAEGGISKSKKVRFYLYYCQKNFDELVQLKNFLDEFGISTGVIHNPSRKADPDFWRFYILTKSHRHFAMKIGSYHPEKCEILRMKI